MDNLPPALMALPLIALQRLRMRPDIVVGKSIWPTARRRWPFPARRA